MVALLFLSLLGAGVVSSSAFIPECATTCVGEAISAAPCSSADTSCICDSSEFMPSLESCIEFNCEEEHQQDAIARADEFCAASKPHTGLRAREAEPEAEAEAEAEPEAEAEMDLVDRTLHHKKCKYNKHALWCPTSKQCVSKCPKGTYRYNLACNTKPAPKPKPYKSKHPKCKYSKNPYWSSNQKKCVKTCSKGYQLKYKECKKIPNKSHHHKCKYSPAPYWSPSAKKCVKNCKYGYKVVNKQCVKPHKPTHTPKPYPTHTKTPPAYTPTKTRYTPTVTPTAYYH